MVRNLTGVIQVNEVHFSSVDQTWCTPLGFYKKLDQEFNFELDPSCTEKSAKCERFFTPKTDGLNQSWEVKNGKSVFCNPPYGKELKKWVKKAYDESKKGITIVLLIPSRTDTSYFHDYIYGKTEIRFIRGRLKFEDENGNTSKNSAPFPSMIVIYNKKGEYNDQT